VKASTLAGADDHPGRLAGHGPIPATVARALAAALTSTLHRVVVDDDGRVLGVDRADWADQTAPPDHTACRQFSDDRFFSGLLRRHVYLRDGSCRMPVCDSPIRDIDHIHPHTAGGPTTADNGQGLSVRCHHLRDLPGWTVVGDGNRTIIWTTPTGHSYQSRPPPALGWGSEPP
nr:HNH endonuclease [Acidimicrobiia bacterium]